MAQTIQARKRARQNIRNRQHNMGLRSAMRTAVKNVLALIEEKKDGETIMAAYKRSSSLLDKAANKHLIHKGKADRQKSRLNAYIKKLVKT